MEEVLVGGHYFEYFFGESRHNRWINAVSVALILAMFGVAAL
jgi:hypothetical protein